MPTDKKISELPGATAITGTDLGILVNSGIDYNFAYSILLNFVAANLTTGATISFGTVAPLNAVGKNGDLFIKTDTSQFLQRVSGTWTVVYTFPSDAADGTVLYGGGVPSSGTGKNGDTYINTSTGIFYLKTSGAWGQQFSMASGPAGPRGNSVLNGTTDPGSGTGLNGDFYFNTATETMFGPKASGTWPAGVVIKGTNGKTILNGLLPPSNLTDGTDGDFFLNTNTYVMYGPKAAGIWPVGFSLISDAPAFRQAYNYDVTDTRFTYNSTDYTLLFTLDADDKLIFTFGMTARVLNADYREKISPTVYKTKKSFDPTITDDGTNYVSVLFEGVIDPTISQIVLY